MARLFATAENETDSLLASESFTRNWPAHADIETITALYQYGSRMWILRRRSAVLPVYCHAYRPLLGPCEHVFNINILKCGVSFFLVAFYFASLLSVDCVLPYLLLLFFDLLFTDAQLLHCVATKRFSSTLQIAFVVPCSLENFPLNSNCKNK